MGYRTNTRVVPGLSPTIVLDGDWLKTGALIKDLPRLILLGSGKGQRSGAEKLKKIVKKYIRQGKAPPGVHWPEFSNDYKRLMKWRGGNPESFYYQTGLYYRSIKVWHNATKTVYYVGVEKGKKRPGTKVTIAKIARLLEMGSAHLHIQARPLWKPAYKASKGSRKIKSLIIWHIRKEIYNAYGVRARVY